jgi:hypothetical protein
MRPVSRKILAVVLLLAAWAQLAFAQQDDQWIADKRGCKVANPFPRQGETITWSGDCKNNFANGEGVLQWYMNGTPDDRYEGNLSMGWAEGRGILYKGDGGKYDGEWQHSMQQGMGRYEAPDGSWYDGQWKNGKPDGSGQYRRPDGKLFMGQWRDGVFEGDEGEGEDEQQEQDNPNKT